MGSSANGSNGGPSLRLTSGTQVLPDSTVGIRSVLAALRRGMRRILITTAVGLLLAALASLFMHKKYDGTATIEITKSSSNQPLGLEDLSGIGAELSVGEQMSSDLLTELSVISSDSTAMTVLQTLHLENTKPFAIPDAVKPDTPLGAARGRPLDQAPLHTDLALAAFHTGLKVDVVKGTRLMTVTFTGRDPQLSAAIANAVVQASIDRYTDARLQASSKASSSLTSQVARLRQAAEEAESKVEAFQKSHGIAGMVAPPSASGTTGGSQATGFSNVPLERLLDLNRQLTAAQIIRNQREAIYRMAKTQDPDVLLGAGQSLLSQSSSADGTSSSDSLVLTQLQQLRTELSQVEVKIATYAGKYGLKNPAMIELQAEKKSLEAHIATELQRIQTRAYNDLKLAVQTEDGLRMQVNAQQREVAQAGNVADELALMQQQAVSARTLYQDLYTKLEEATVVAGLRASNISVIDPARAPSKPSSPVILKNIALGGILGMLLGVGFTTALEFWGDTLYSANEVQRAVSLPLWGVIPGEDTGAPSRWSRWIKQEPRLSEADAYRALRTSLLRQHETRGARVVLFAGTGTGHETHVACRHTALAFAQQGYRTLLIDADLRSGDGASASSTGLSGCLTGGAAMDALLQAAPESSALSVLPSGATTPDAPELLGGELFRQLLHQALERFEFVFLDSPPADKYVDAQVLAQRADVGVIAVRAGETTQKSIETVLTALRSNDQLAVGLCVTGATT